MIELWKEIIDFVEFDQCSILRLVCSLFDQLVIDRMNRMENILATFFTLFRTGQMKSNPDWFCIHVEKCKKCDSIFFVTEKNDHQWINFDYCCINNDHPMVNKYDRCFTNFLGQRLLIDNCGSKIYKRYGRRFIVDSIDSSFDHNDERWCRYFISDSIVWNIFCDYDGSMIIKKHDGSSAKIPNAISSDYFPMTQGMNQLLCTDAIVFGIWDSPRRTSVILYYIFEKNEVWIVQNHPNYNHPNYYYLNHDFEVLGWTADWMIYEVDDYLIKLDTKMGKIIQKRKPPGRLYLIDQKNPNRLLSLNKPGPKIITFNDLDNLLNPFIEFDKCLINVINIE
jgi:hypothetical protein